MDNPKQRMIKKPSFLAFGKNHMLFATEQQNFLSSGVLLRLIMQGACVPPHVPADGVATWVEGAPQKHIEWREVTGWAGPEALMGNQVLVSLPLLNAAPSTSVWLTALAEA